MLAVSEPTIQVASTTNATSYALGAFTPSANALLVLHVGASDTVAAGSVSGGGLTWTRQAVATIAGANSVYVFTAPTGASPASCTPTFDCTGDAASGCALSIQEWTGTNLQVVQAAASEGTEQTPDHVFSSALNTNNGYSGSIFTTNDRPTITQPTNWTVLADHGYNTPSCQQVSAYRINGESSTSVTWNLGNECEWGVAAIEIKEADEPVAPSGVEVGLHSGYMDIVEVVGY